MPVLPTVDITTGTVSNGPIKLGEQFQWTTTANDSNISVHAPVAPNSQWFSPNPTPSFNGPGNVTVTATMTSGANGWSYTATNINVNANARVHVQASMPQAKAS